MKEVIILIVLLEIVVRTIKIHPDTYEASGIFGTYHIDPMREKGTKVIRCRMDNDESYGCTISYEGSFDNIGDLMKSPIWLDAEYEAKAIMLMESSGFTPKFYELVVVDYSKDNEDTYYLPGIVMEHIEGKTLQSSGILRKDIYCQDLEEKILKDFDVEMGDLHCGNVIMRNDDPDDLVVIDFSAEFTNCPEYV